MAKTKPSWAKVTGPLAEYADGFRAELLRLGYTPLTAACQLRLTAHLSRWLTAEGVAPQDLDMPTAERYFAARRLAGYANERTTEALGPLLGYLRRLRTVPLPPAETGDGDEPAAGPIRGLPGVRARPGTDDGRPERPPGPPVPAAAGTRTRRAPGPGAADRRRGTGIRTGPGPEAAAVGQADRDRAAVPAPLPAC